MTNKIMVLDLTACRPTGWMEKTSVRIIPIEIGNYDKHFDVMEDYVNPAALAAMKADSIERADAKGWNIDESLPIGVNWRALPEGAVIRFMDNLP